MNEENIFLIEPTAELTDEFLAMAAEFQSAGEDSYKSALEDFPAYLENLSDKANGLNLAPGRVREKEFWMIKDGRIVARSKLRLELTPALRNEGGHIGYDVRPSARRKGYGKLLLKLTLEKAENEGLKKVLITCDTDNTGSAKIIENNGGKLTEKAISQNSEKEISRYRIEI